MSESVALLLRHTYAQINERRLYNLTSIPLADYEDLLTDLNNISDTTFFIKGDDLPKYLNENINKYKDSDIITIVGSDIINIYWDHRELLSLTDLEKLNNMINQSLPIFDNVMNSDITLPTLENSIYYLLGDITPYNVLHITVQDFRDAINNNKPIEIKLNKIDIKIILNYELFDFYNNDLNLIEDSILR
jgi:hypothetical protein